MKMPLMLPILLGSNMIVTYEPKTWLSSQMGFFVSHSRATDCDIGKVFALNSQGDLIFFFFQHLWQMVEIYLHIFLCKNVFVISYMALVYLVQC